MKRKFVTLLLLLGLICGLGGLSACADEDGGSLESSGKETFTVQAAYAKAQELGYKGNLEEFIASISGKDGKDGIGISSVYFNKKNELVVKYTDGREEVVGKIPACVHNYGDWIEDKKATCTSIGVNYRVCADCGYVQHDIMPNEGHDLAFGFVTNEGETLCENGGAYALYCTNEGCEYVQSSVEVSAQGHHSGAWEVITEPTLETEGKLKGVCTGCEVTVDEERKITYKGCGATLEKSLPALNENDYTSEGRTNCEIEETVTYSITIDGQEFSFEKIFSTKDHSIATSDGGAEEIAVGSTIYENDIKYQGSWTVVNNVRITCGGEALAVFECTECNTLVVVYITRQHNMGYEYVSESEMEYEFLYKCTYNCMYTEGETYVSKDLCSEEILVEATCSKVGQRSITVYTNSDKTVVDYVVIVELPKIVHTLTINGDSVLVDHAKVYDYDATIMTLIMSDSTLPSCDSASGITAIFTCEECGYAMCSIHVKMPHSKPEGLEEGVTEYECTVCKQKVTE